LMIIFSLEVSCTRRLSPEDQEQTAKQVNNK
jgi:hypothetical protein